ncbi:DNA/RNA non-specific endonuclease [Cereibacter sp. SYSU M97828]|nr:DNA/RNA non-specific endonuclease [Cereibacter flavus]
MIRSFGPLTDADDLRVTESLRPLDSYDGRGGYDPAFIPGDPLPLPGAGAWADDLVPVEGGGTEIRYTHFSVLMSASRALPLFSACNIDGKLSDRDVPRTDTWRRDPRIDNQFQNLREGYGDERRGLFSRGHMTRREDPNWGDRETAKQADADTFHITNVAPQRQGFNGGIWLDLENYVLDNADRANLKVTVITGPVLAEDDPVYYNRKIPTAFWKVLAFIHAETGALTTIGYRRSQMDHLPRPVSRFIFGDFEDTQVSIASIAEETGLDLSAFAEHDVMAGGEAFQLRVRSVSDFYLSR